MNRYESEQVPTRRPRSAARRAQIERAASMPPEPAMPVRAGNGTQPRSPYARPEPWSGAQATEGMPPAAVAWDAGQLARQTYDARGGMPIDMDAQDVAQPRRRPALYAVSPVDSQRAPSWNEDATLAVHSETMRRSPAAQGGAHIAEAPVNEAWDDDDPPPSSDEFERKNELSVARRMRALQVVTPRARRARTAPWLEQPATPMPSPQGPEAIPWDDTSTNLPATEARTFFHKQPPVFWIVAAVLCVALVVVALRIVGNIWSEGMQERAERARIQQLEEEKAKYKLLYRDSIEQNAYEQGVDPALVAAVIYNESRFDPSAVSRVGARGLMQIMDETGKWIAGKFNEDASYTKDALFDTETNLKYGIWYLGFLARMFDNDIVKIAAGYHAGQNDVLRWLTDPAYSRDGKSLEIIPIAETDQYVKRVIATYEIYKRHYYSDEEVSGDPS